MYMLTDEDYEVHTERLLQWMRNATPGVESAIQHPITIRLGLAGTLTPAREEEFIDAFLLAPQNGAAIAERVFDSACSRGGMRLVQFLLPMVGVDWTDSNFSEPLTKAASSGHVGVVQFLLAQLSTLLSDQVHLLMLRKAVERGHIEMVEFLLKLADENFDVNASSKHEDEHQLTCGSLLERALQWDQIAVASLLLSHGASGLHDTPEILRWISSVAMAELLYSHGADFSDEVGLKMALSAIHMGDNALFFYLLDHGVDIRRVTYTATTSPFHAACHWGIGNWKLRHGTKERVDFFGEMSSRAIIDVDARGADGLTALQSLGSQRFAHDKEELTKKLVDLGATTEACEGLEQ